MAKEDDNTQKKKEQTTQPAQAKEERHTSSPSPSESSESTDSPAQHIPKIDEEAAAAEVKKARRELDKAQAKTVRPYDVDSKLLMPVVKFHADGDKAYGLPPGGKSGGMIPAKLQKRAPQQQQKSMPMRSTMPVAGPFTARLQVGDVGGIVKAAVSGLIGQDHRGAVFINGDLHIVYLGAGAYDEDEEDEEPISAADSRYGPLPPPTPNDARICLIDVYTILGVIATMKDEVADKGGSVSFSQVAPSPNWINICIGNVGRTLQTFGGPNATSHRRKHLENMAQQALQALREIQPGARGEQQEDGSEPGTSKTGIGRKRGGGREGSDGDAEGSGSGGRTRKSSRK